MTDQLIALAGQFGAPGFLVAFMVWQQLQRNTMDKERIAADLEVAKSLTLLAERMNHGR